MLSGVQCHREFLGYSFFPCKLLKVFREKSDVFSDICQPNYQTSSEKNLLTRGVFCDIFIVLKPYCLSRIIFCGRRFHMEIVQTEAVHSEVNLALPSEQETQLEMLEEIQEVQDLEVEYLPEIPDEEVRPLFVVGGTPFGAKFVAASVAVLLLGLCGPWVFAQGEIGSIYSQKDIGLANEMASREAQLAPIKQKIQELTQ
jgi:hypothetical protein